MIIQGVTLNGVRVVDATFNTSNLVLHLDANQASSYSGSGTTVNDISGNGHTHTLTGATYTMLNGVKCFDCTTGTSRVVVNSTGPTLPTSGFTYTTWARLQPGNSSSFRTLLNTNSPKYTPITIPNNSNTLGYWDTAFRSSGYDLASAIDTWVQYAVVGDNSSQTFYINGVQAGNSIAQGPGGTTHWGWGNNDVAQPWGHVANLQLYNTKLTAEKIQQNYYNQLSTFTLSNIVTSNLVLWYDPSVSASYSGSGSTINNLASTSLSGTMSNITHTSPYFSYNGTNSQVSITDNSLLEPGSGSWTMEAWAYLSNTGAGTKTILGKFDPGGGSQDVSYSMRISTATAFAQMGDGLGNYINSTSYTLTANTWTHIVYVWKNGATKTLETYINGTSIGSVNHSLSSVLNTPANLYLGSYNNGEYSQWMNGRIGITRLYSAALSGADVLQNYNADKSKYGL